MSDKQSAAPRRSQFGRATVFTAAILGIVGTMPASAQGVSTGWKYEVTPYLWTSGIRGDTRTPNTPNSHVDAKFTDVFKEMDFAFMGGLEARNGKWGLLADLMYVKLSPGATASGTGALGNPVSASVDLTVKQTTLSGAVAYRVSEGPSPVDVIGGLRYTNVDVQADTDFSSVGFSSSMSRGGSKGWTDPYLGVRIQHPLSDRWTLTGYADVGGFGAGSDLTWQAAVGANYKISDRMSLKFGYRYLYMDYDKNGYVYKMTQDGLYAGLGIRF
ncbi:MAG: hypothetical protein RIS35_2248 [Pseudomonadota bacterium]